MRASGPNWRGKKGAYTHSEILLVRTWNPGGFGNRSTMSEGSTNLFLDTMVSSTGTLSWFPALALDCFASALGWGCGGGGDEEDLEFFGFFLPPAFCSSDGGGISRSSSNSSRRQQNVLMVCFCLLEECSDEILKR